MSERGEMYHHTWEEGDGIHVTIVAALAEVTGQPETDLPPLYDAVDVEAMDELLRRNRREIDREPITVSFTYLGYRITARSDGSVLVHQQDPQL